MGCRDEILILMCEHEKTSKELHLDYGELYLLFQILGMKINVGCFCLTNIESKISKSCALWGLTDILIL